MTRPLNILIVDDSEDDATLLVRHLRDGGLTIQYDRVDVAVAMTAALENKKWDVILCGHKMPRFSVEAALALAHGAKLYVPFIVVSGEISEDRAVDVMKLGVHDLVLKGNLARLLPAIERELAEAQVRRAHDANVQALRESETRYRQLVEMSPDSIVVHRDGKIVFLNAVGMRLFGAQRPEQLIGMSIFELIHSDSRDFVRKHVLRASEKEEFLDLTEYRFQRLDGSNFYAEVAGAAIDYDGHTARLLVIRDVTGRKQVADALALSELRFRAVIDHSPATFQLIDSEGHFLLFNKKYQEWYGITEENWLGKSGYDFFPKELAMALTDLDEEVLATNLDVWRILEVPFLDGTLHQLEITKFPVMSPDGEILGVGSIGTDVTEQARALEELTLNEARFSAFINNSPDVIALKDVEGQFLLVNQTFCEWYGVTDESWHGKTDYDFMPKDRADAVTAEDERVLSGNTVIHGELELPHTEGWRHNVEFTKFPVKGADGQIFGVGSIIRDVTERIEARQALTQSEARFSAVINNSPELIVLKDLEGRYLLANGTFEEWNGVPEGTWLGKTDDELLPKEMAAAVQSLDKEVLVANTVVHREIEVPLADGALHKLKVTKFPVRDDSGGVVGVGTIGDDVTIQRSTEDQLRQAQKMEAVGELAGGIAHDFNNLLSIMIGNAEFLEREIKEDEKAERNVAAIIRAVERAATLTHRLLAFSRQQILSPKPTAIDSLALGLEELLDRTLGETIDLRVEVVPDLWPAMIDASQLEHAVINLAVNARDAMSDGGTLVITITNVTVEETDGDWQEKGVTPGDYVEVAVSDTGAGMTPKVLKKAFDPFFTTKVVGEGTGLGLSMVYGFVTQSNGHITIDSEVGHGTTIKLYMPRSVDSVTKDHTNKVTHEFERGMERILVIEDDPDVRDLAVAIFRNQGYEVVEAQNGKEAIKHLKDGQLFDLLFTDIVLPGGMTGFDSADQAKQLQPNIKVVFATGYADDTIGHRAEFDLGRNLIRKPYRRVELLKTVRSRLDRADN